jgi:SAM-dependent methyltransferase
MEETKNQLINLLACPDCFGDLKVHENELACSSCNKNFSFHNENIPNFLPKDIIEKSAVQSHISKGGIKQSIKKIAKIFTPPHHSVYMANLKSSYHEEPAFDKFIKKFGSEKIANIINIGSLSKNLIKENSNINIFNLDISAYKNIDIIADAHKLPFKDHSIDGVIIKNVFEHLKDPNKVRDELKRVVKKGGFVYAKVPFMQPFHAVPDDYQRYSLNGIHELFKDFNIVDEGISVGPSSALAWFLDEYFGILFSFNSKWGYKISKAMASYYFNSLKYLDRFFRKRKDAHKLASAFYVILENK